MIRNPPLRQRFEASLRQLRADFTDVVQQHQDNGTLPTSVDAVGIAGLLLAILPGFILQLTLLGDATVDDIGAAARALWPS